MRIFVDMDGTLAKWNNVEFEQLFEQGYYRNLEPNAALVAEVRGLIQNGNDVYILSAYLTESDYAYQEKLDWLDEHIPELTAEKTILLPYGENKAAYLKEHYSPIAHDDVLIDDYTQNLLEWRDYGGEGIKYLNGINHTRGTWKGLTTDGQTFHLRDTIQAFGNDAERMQGLLSSGDMSFRYQLLDRLRSDCDYFLGNGGAQDKFLWGSNIHSHIYFMRGLWNSLPEGEKPEWLSLPDINNYERQMLFSRDYQNQSLAEHLVSFAKNTDFYDYADNLEIGETDGNAVSKMAEYIKDKSNCVGIISYISDYLAERIIDEHEKQQTFDTPDYSRFEQVQQLLDDLTAHTAMLEEKTAHKDPIQSDADNFDQRVNKGVRKSVRSVLEDKRTEHRTDGFNQNGQSVDNPRVTKDHEQIIE